MGWTRVGYALALTLAAVGAGSCSDYGTKNPEAIGSVRSALSTSFEARLTDTAGLPSDEYGASLSLSPTDGDLIAGAPGEAGTGARQGAAYTYYQILGVRNWSFRQRLVAPDGAAGDAFGTAVAVSATTAFVGAPGNDDRATNAGAVYVFTRTGTQDDSLWTYAAKLVASDAASGDEFGAALSLQGDVLAIGAPGKAGTAKPMQGAAYLFAQEGGVWKQKQQVSSASSAAQARFGSALDLDGNALIVGGPGQSGTPAETGGAWIFEPSAGAWTEVASFPGTRAGGRRGAGVAIAGGRALVGAPNEQANGAGRVIVLSRASGSWVAGQTLAASDAAPGDSFGTVVTLDATRAIVGAPLHDEGGVSEAGATYTFILDGEDFRQIDRIVVEGEVPAKAHMGAQVALADVFGATSIPGFGTGALNVYRQNSGWTFEAQLMREGVMRSVMLGTCAATNGQRLVLGAPGYWANGAERSSGAGMVYVKSAGAWKREAILRATDRLPGDQLGASCALDGDTIVLGAPQHSLDSTTQEYIGRAQTFVRGPNGWAQQSTLVAPVQARDAVFGSAVAISGTTLVVGSPPRFGFGAAYAYRKTAAGWGSGTKIAPSDGTQFDRFGSVLAFEGNLLAVGAPGVHGTQGDEMGAAYVFELRNGAFVEIARLADPVPSLDQAFGSAVAVSNGKVYVSSPGRAPGVVHVFERSGAAFVLTRSVRSPTPADADHFGYTIAADGNTLAVVGQHMENPWYYEAYLFEAGSGGAWSFDSILAQPPDFLIGGLALRDGTLVAGAQGLSVGTHGLEAGGAFVYRVCDALSCADAGAPPPVKDAGARDACADGGCDAGSEGAIGSGGATGAGGATGTGGAGGVGGAEAGTSAGGAEAGTSAGGAEAGTSAGGTVSTGGVKGSGGVTGAGGTSSGGNAVDAGPKSTDATEANAHDDGGCGCRITDSRTSNARAAWLLAMAAVLVARRSPGLRRERRR